VLPQKSIFAIVDKRGCGRTILEELVGHISRYAREFG